MPLRFYRDPSLSLIINLFLGALMKYFAKTFAMFFVVVLVSFIGCSKEEKKNTGLDLTLMDTTVSPAKDFYTYAVGNWVKNNPVPAEYSSWGSFHELMDMNQKNLKELAEQAAADQSKDKSPVEQKVGDMYKSGMDSAKVEADGYKPVEGTLQAIASVKTKEEAIKQAAELYKIGTGSFFAFYTAPDAKNSTMNVAQLEQGGLGLPDRDYYVSKDAHSKEAREKYQAHIAKMFTLVGETEDQAAKDAKTVLTFETKLAELAWPRVELRDPVKTYNKMTLAQVSDLTKGFDWTLFFKSVGAENPGDLVVGEPSFFKGFGPLFASTPLEDLKTYMKWHALSDAAPFLSSPFVNESFEFYSKYLNGAQAMRPRWKRVLGTIDGTIGEAMGQLYVEKYFPATSKEKAKSIVSKLLEAYAERIKTLDWMSEATKQQALHKLSKFKVKIGYPDKWKDYSKVEITPDSYYGNVVKANKFEFEDNVNKIGKPVDKTEWEMTPQTVNAYYNPLNNEIVFPAAILQPPFFNPDADDAVNYGAMGAVIGHEVTHGFDDQGRQFDSDGNITDWWTAEDASKFKAKAQKIIDQYSKYEPLDSVYVNGELTQGENIADLGGLSIAYAAFQNTDQYKKGEKIDGFTPAQRFFLSWAQVWRTNTRDAQARVWIKIDPHSPGKFRVLGPLSDMPEFYAAFNVKPGDAMMQADSNRVKIW